MGEMDSSKQCRDPECPYGVRHLECFGVDRQQKDGLTTRCRDCISRRRKELHQANPEAQRAYQRAWQARNLDRSMLRAAKQRAKEKNRPFNLTVADIQIPERCPVFDQPLIKSGKRSDWSPSIDCLVPSLGYTKGNVRIISWRANRIKCDASLEEMEALLLWMRKELSK